MSEVRRSGVWVLLLAGLLLSLAVTPALALPSSAPPEEKGSPGGLETLEMGGRSDLVAELSQFESAPAPPPGPPEAPRGLPAIQRAWSQPAPNLRARVDRTRQALDRIGLRNLEPAARALLLDESAGSLLERAGGAVRLAPDLPSARMAYAGALWSERGERLGALRTAFGAVASMTRHLEAALWLDATVASAGVFALLFGAFLFLGVLCASLAPHAAHDLGDRLSPAMPFFARAALLAALIFLPVALGEGVLGLGLALFCLAICYGRGAQRMGALAAGLALVLGLHPIADRAGSLLAHAGADPVAEAVFAVENGLSSQMDLLRLEHASVTDPLATRALALQDKRAGRLEEARERYEALLAEGNAQASLLNNAGNVRLRLGDAKGAIDLYEQAVKQTSSVPLLFNLAQAYGQAIQLEEQNLALAEAQEIDAPLVAELANRYGSAGRQGVVDVPVTVSELRKRMVSEGSGDRAARAIRGRYAPGALGKSLHATMLSFVVAFVAALLLATLFRASHWCARCGARLCPRCDRNRGSAELCVGCTRLFRRPESIEAGLRARRLAELRERAARVERFTLATSLALPGAAGIFAQRPLLALAAAHVAALGVACFVWSGGAVADPLAVGATGRFAFLTAGLGFAGAYALLLTVSLRARRSG